MIVGRERERRALDELIAAARARRGGALVLRGEPGIGRSTLLAYASDAALGMLVLRTAGIEDESAIALAGVHRLIAPLLGRLAAVPGPQRKALTTALGLASGPSPEPLFVRLGALALLSAAGADRPVLCLVDDVQWLDPESVETLAFVARRLDGEPVAMLFAVREPAEPRLVLAGLDERTVTGLAQADAEELLASAVDGRLDERVRDRLVAEARGNPLGLLEFARTLTAGELAGTSALPDPPLHDGVLDQGFLRRARSLPDATQTLLLLLAAERRGDTELVWAAAGALGVPSSAPGPAEAEGLLALEPQLAFRHPLVRSAILRGARADELRRAHRALAKAADRQHDPEMRAWYRAASIVEPDDEIAAELSESARSTERRDGYGAAAPIYVRAAQLTRDPALRAERTLAAAHVELQAGASRRANALLASVAPDLLDARELVTAERVRRGIDYELGRPGPPAEVLLAGARAIEAFDPDLARGAHLRALFAALTACRLGSPDGVGAAALAALTAPPAEDPTARDLLLNGFALLFAQGHAAAVPPLRSAIALLRSSDEPPLLILGGVAARELWNDEAIHALLARAVSVARDTGARAILPRALNALAGTYDVVVGAFDYATAHLREAQEIRGATAPAVADRGNSTRMLVAAWRGQEAEARRLIHETLLEAAARGQGLEISLVYHALAVLEIGRARYTQALVAAQDATEYPTLLVVPAALPELVEAAVRCDEPDAAAAAVERIAQSTLAAGTPWALGILARSRALVAEDDEAEALYQEAIAQLKRSRAIPQLARAHLLYGEWLRRARRRRDARAELRRAEEMFDAMGAAAFAERTRNELAASGERARPRASQEAERLTPQELRIATLVAEGASNPQIAAQLLISRRTVEYHLRKIFRKLGIASRTQVGSALPTADTERRGPVRVH